MTKSRLFQKRVAVLLLALPALVYMALVYFCGVYNLQNWRLILLQTGFIASGLLIFVLMLNPLRRVLPTISSISFFNRFRRQIGVAVFGYALLHYIAVIMKVICKTGSFWPSYLLNLVPMTGFVALVLLFLLAVTSNDYSVRAMGGKRWKRLHYWTYVVEGLVMVHLLLQGGLNSLLACLLFIPLIILQLYSKRLNSKN